MRRFHIPAIKEAEVDLTKETFAELRGELFLVTMTFGDPIRKTYAQRHRPGNADFDAREWNLFKPILAVGPATGNSEIVQSLMGFANSAYDLSSTVKNVNTNGIGMLTWANKSLALQ